MAASIDFQNLLEFENNSANPAAWYAYFKQFEVPPAALPETGDI